MKADVYADRAKQIMDAQRVDTSTGEVEDEPEHIASVSPIDPAFDAAVETVRHQRAIVKEADRRDWQEDAEALRNKFHPITLGNLLNRPDIRDWLVPDLLERRDRFVLVGGEGGGKSYLMRQLAITIAAGVHPFAWRQQIEPRKVLVIDAENTEDQWARAARYITGRVESIGVRSPRDHVIVNAGDRIDLANPAALDLIHRMLDEHEPDILYVGPLYKLTTKEITTETEAAPLLIALDGIRERGVTLLVEAHAGHAKGADGERAWRPRGSSALLGWPEFGFGLAPIKSDDPDDDIVMVNLARWRGDREARDWPERLRRGVEGELPWMPA